MLIMGSMLHFNPRFPRGKRPLPLPTLLQEPRFQSTLPAGEATTPRLTRILHWPHFNPRFPRGKRQKSPTPKASNLPFQSTLPAGEATGGSNHPLNRGVISIHASRGGSDVQNVGLPLLDAIFQSTLPAGEATALFRASLTICRRFQSTLPAGEATKCGQSRRRGLSAISIHASRGGSDKPEGQGFTSPEIFQSTLPAGEATVR